VPYIVTLTQIDEIAIAAVRRRAAVADFSRIVPLAIGEVWNFIRARRFTGTGRNVAVYLGGQANIVDLECGVEAPVDFVGNDEVLLSATPAGLVAHTEHVGDYGRLGQAHAAIRRWCASNNHVLIGPNWEVYGHWKDDPEKVTTDVFYLLDR
jgi:effector-binding domain-containing protein